MSSPNQRPKSIHFPGGTGQRRQANYLIVAGPPEVGGIVFDTRIVFIADPNDPGGYDPDWETVLSSDPDANAVPDYLINKVLVQELSNCRLDLIQVFFVPEPNAANRREVYRWNFKVDYDRPIGDDPFRTTCRIYPSHWDRIKALFRIPGAVFETKGLTTRSARAGVYPVQVDDKPVLPDQKRLEILLAIDLARGL